VSGPTIAIDGSDTLANAIRRRLADRILNGEYNPDQRFDEQDLALEFGVSRTPIREALRQLDAAGLVEVRPRRGAVIVPIDRERIGHAFEAAAELEGVASAWAAARATVGERRDLVRLHEEGSEAVAAKDPEWYANVNRRLHDRISELARNPSLTDAVAAVRVKTAPFQKSQFAEVERMEASQGEHDRIVTAICFQDADAAKQFMKEHVLRASFWILAGADEQSNVKGVKA
jgi:DNA-binding GntR family transcriptional regulator